MLNRILTMTYHNEFKLTRTACLVAVVCISGCIGLPVPSNEMLEEYIPEENLSFLDAGVTTKAEVIENLSEPAATFSNGSTWVYRANLRATLQLAACVYALGGRECGKEPLVTKYGLVNLDFDAKGVLSDWDLSYAELGECSNKGVCGLSGPYYMILASRSADQAAKKFDVSGNDCAIYLYPHEQFRISYFKSPMRVKIEDVFYTWFRDYSETYLYRELPADSYLVITVYEDQEKSIRLACNAGAVVFIRFFKFAGNDDYDLEVVTESAGQAAIEHRRLILFEDITSLTTSP